jgi:predicted MFS family arabinose efflux permease
MPLDFSWTILFVVLLAVICLIFTLKCLKMPENFKKNQQAREEIKKRLRHSRIEN